MKAKVEIINNQARITVPRYGNGLMLLMEYVSGFDSNNVIGNVTQYDDYFDIVVKVTNSCACDIKKYINNNL